MPLNFHPPGPSHPFEGRGGENFILIGVFVELEAARKVPERFILARSCKRKANRGFPALGAFRVRDVNPEG